MDLVVPSIAVEPILPLPLAAFGWTPERAAAFAEHAAAGLIPGRVVSTGGVMRATAMPRGTLNESTPSG